MNSTTWAGGSKLQSTRTVRATSVPAPGQLRTEERHGSTQPSGALGGFSPPPVFLAFQSLHLADGTARYPTTASLPVGKKVPKSTVKSKANSVQKCVLAEMWDAEEYI